MDARRFLLAVPLAAGLAACGPAPVWTRSGATTETAGADLDACRTAARQEATQFGGVYGGVGVGYYRGPRRLGWGPGWGPFFGGDIVWEESRLTDFCMRTKGYALTTPTQG